MIPMTTICYAKSIASESASNGQEFARFRILRETGLGGSVKRSEANPRNRSAIPEWDRATTPKRWPKADAQLGGRVGGHFLLGRLLLGSLLFRSFLLGRLFLRRLFLRRLLLPLRPRCLFVTRLAAAGLSGRKLETVSSIFLERQRRRERPAEARGKVLQQIGLAIGKVDFRCVPSDFPLARPFAEKRTRNPSEAPRCRGPSRPWVVWPRPFRPSHS